MDDPVPFFDAMQSFADRLEAAALPKRFPVQRTTRTEPREPIPKEIRRAVHMRDNWRCQWCSKHWTEAALELDHIIPWSAGGSDQMDNLRTLCHDCNTLRSNFDIDTEQRKPPIADCCASCQPSQFWTDDEYGIETGRVFCVKCRFVGTGPRYDL